MGGLIAGLVAAKITDRFYRLELPLAFAFFSGKKSVAIISIAAMIPIGLIIPIIWSGFTALLTSMSGILMSDHFGSGLYYTLNRLLIPFGLHHVFASMVRFTEAGGTYLIDGELFVGILPAMNRILFDLGPSHPAWAEHMPKISSYLACGLVNFAVFYALFRFAIVKFDIKTPGREDDVADNSLLNNKEYDKVAALVLQVSGWRKQHR